MNLQGWKRDAVVAEAQNAHFNYKTHIVLIILLRQEVKTRPLLMYKYNNCSGFTNICGIRFY